MAAADDNGNGRITSAIIGEKVDNLASAFVTFSTRMEATVAKLTESTTRHEEMSKAHCHELYRDGQSRIQQAESDAKAAMAWVRIALVPIGLILVIELIKGASSLIRG
jgi:hypothetical protein